MTGPRAEMPDMSAYGVEASTWSPLPWAWAAEKLLASRNFWVATVRADGRPHATPVWGVWDDAEHRFAFSCSPRSQKARNLAGNPHTTILGEDTVECLSIDGRSVPVTDVARQDQWIGRYLAKYRPVAPELDGDFLRDNLLVELEPVRAIAVIERPEEFSTRATRWVFGR